MELSPPLSPPSKGGRDHRARRSTPAARTLVSRGSTKTTLKLRCGALQLTTSGRHRTPLSAIANNGKSAHNRTYHSTTVQISSKSQKKLQGESNPRPQQPEPRLQPRRRHPRRTHRALGARPVINHSSDVTTSPIDTTRRLRPPVPPQLKRLCDVQLCLGQHRFPSA